MSGSAYLLDAVRTPFGRYGGALAGVRPDDLAALALSGLLERSPGLDPAEIDDVLFGDANGAGEDNRNVARMAVLLAGLPTSLPGATVNRLCGSGLGGGDRRQPGDRDRRRLADRRRRGGVDEPRALGAAEARAGLPQGARGASLDDPRLAHGQPADAGSLDDLARRERRAPRRSALDLTLGPGRVRAAQPPAGGRRLGAGLLRRPGRRGTRRRAGARREHPLGDHDRGALEAAAGLSRGRDRDRRQRLAAQRRRRGDPDRRRDARRSGPAASRWRGSPPAPPPASTPTSSGSARCRPPTTPSRAPASAGTTWPRWS